MNKALFYSTRAESLPSILKHGIPTVEVPRGRDAYLNCVCMTENGGLASYLPERLRRLEFRLTVESDDVQRWSDTAQQCGIPKRYYEKLGWPEAAQMWVIRRRIFPDEITDIWSSILNKPLCEHQIEWLREMDEIRGRDLSGGFKPTTSERESLSRVLGGHSPWQEADHD